MKKLYLLLLAVIASCPVLAMSPEAKFVIKFAESLGTSRVCKECISPKYLKKYDLVPSEIKIYWGSADVSLVSDTPPSIVVETINRKEGWAYQLTFKVAKENGDFAIVPRYQPRFDDHNGIYPYDSEVRVMWNHARYSKAEQQQYVEDTRDQMTLNFRDTPPKKIKLR